MRFSTAILSVAGIAQVAYGHYDSQEPITSTVYATTVYTISKCAPTVTDCPYDSTSVITETYSVSTTEVPPVETETDIPYETETEIPEVSTHPGYNATIPIGTGVPTTPIVPEETECGTPVVKTITTEYTTVIPTVLVVTETAPCQESTGVYPTGSVPVGTGSVPSTPIPSEPPVIAGASSMAGSALFAAAAGVAAVLFA